MKRAIWRMVALAMMGAAWGAVAWGGTCPETVLDRQGDWKVVQADDGTVKTLFLEKSDGTARTPLARVEVPSVTVTNVYWDEFAGWDAQNGKAVGGMVTNVETIAGEFTFRAFVNDGAVYWEDREDGLARLWTVPCKLPEEKTLLAADDAGEAWGTSTFDAEPLNRGAAWQEAGADGETLAVFEDGETKRLSGEEAVAFKKKVIHKGVEEYETDHGYYVGWDTFEHDGRYGDIQRQRTVVVPDGVTRIGMGLFYGCTNLASVTIPDSVESIGHYAFYECRGLTNVVMGNGVTSIGERAFSHCNGLTSVMISGSVTSMWSGAFSHCSGLTSVTIGNGVTSIGNAAFYGCRSLTSVTIGNGVTSIGNMAFDECSGLTSVTIPDRVTSIGWGAFSGCRSLKELRVPKAWEGTSMLNKVWGWEGEGKPEECEIIYYEPGELGEAVVVPEGWIYANAREILDANGGDYAAAAKAEAANGMRVWECYLTGLSPTDAAAEFKVKSMEFVDGQLVVTWDPDLNDGETKKEREYTLEGAETLGGAWGATNAASRFFRVRVGLP